MLDKYKGCLLGLAVGDALGASVAFLPPQEIKKKYGKDGITDFVRWNGFKLGSYTYKTQLALATTIGCIRASQMMITKGACNPADVIYRRYQEWLESQNDPSQIRVPDYTCLSALQTGIMGTIENAINDSRGSGGVMHAAPIGLAFPSDMVFREGAECVAITHGHPSGYLSGGFVSEMIAHIIEGKTLSQSIEFSKEQLMIYEGYEPTLSKIERAYELSSSQRPIEKSIQEIGQRHNGEEALAISIYFSLKFVNDFKRGVLSDINHSYDSDSTGALTGAILGALLGLESIPTLWIQKLENTSKINSIAEDMFKIFQKKELLSFEKYPPE